MVPESRVGVDRSGVRGLPANWRAVSYRLRNVPLPEPYLLGIAVAVGIDAIRPWALPGPRIVYRLLGGPLIAAGAWIALWSVQAAGHVNLQQPDRVVTSGPYALSRNPMYLGWALLHLGVGVAGRSGWIVATLPVAAGLVHRDVRREERQLSDTLGEEFGRYRAAVPRYFPRGGRPAILI